MNIIDIFNKMTPNIKKDTLNFLKSWGLIILLGVVLFVSFETIICKIPKWFSNNYFEIFPENKLSTKDSIERTSAISSTYSGTLGPVIAIVAAYLTFIAFWIQYRANRIQSTYIKQQRFEDTFFRLVDLHRINLSAIDTRQSNDETKVLATGTDSFRSMYRDFFQKDLKESKEIDKINNTYNKLQAYYRHDLQHYFRFLYHILKFIKSAEIPEEEKFKYASILRATLSAYELVLIFYNGIHVNGNSHLKPLIEYFSFLKNIDKSLLFNESQMREYHELAFSPSKERRRLLKDWLKQQTDNNKA